MQHTIFRTFYLRNEFDDHLVFYVSDMNTHFITVVKFLENQRWEIFARLSLNTRNLRARQPREITSIFAQVQLSSQMSTGMLPSQ